MIHRLLDNFQFFIIQSIIYHQDSVSSFYISFDHLLKAFSVDNHEDIAERGLFFLKEEVLADIADENEYVDATGQTNPHWHFDNCSFSRAFEEINDEYSELLNEIEDEDYEQAADEFGQLLHTVQDFYAHSNWVELGRTSLFESGLTFWNSGKPLAPYREFNGVVIIQDLEDDRETLAEVWTLELLEGNQVEATSIGDPYDGLISGEAYLGIGCPSGVSVGHWDSNPNNPLDAGWTPPDEDKGQPGYGSGLNKDTDSRPGFPEARRLGIMQTTHEWCRLVSMVSQRGGDTAVANLFKAWVDPDQINEAIAACLDLNIDVMSTVPELLDLEIIQVTDSSNMLDLIFVIDTTGSMEDDIDEVKANALDVINQVAVSESNWQIGIVTYRDHPQAPYGDPGDYPSRIELTFSSNQSDIIAAINGIIVGGGGDGPESVYSGLMEAIRFPWRDGARKIIILMGDAPPHDPEPITNLTLEDVLVAAFNVDPANVFPILIENDTSTRRAFQSIADGSSGRLFNAERASDVVDILIAAIEQATGEGNLTVGGFARVPLISDDERLNLRSGAGTEFDIQDKLTSGTVVEVIGGPQLVFPHIWWQVRSPVGTEGWSVEADEGEITLFQLTGEEAETIPSDQCLVITTDVVNMRAGAGTGNAIQGQLQEGETAVVVGHSATDAFTWYRLENGGWVREDVVGLVGNCQNV